MFLGKQPEYLLVSYNNMGTFAGRKTICELSIRIAGTYQCRHFSISQSAFTCSKIKIEKLEQGVKYVQS